MSSTSLLVIACVLGPAVCLAAAWWCCCVRGQTEHTHDGRNDERKPLPDDHFQADVEDHAGTLQHHIPPQELRALREAQHGQIATSFYEFDADGSGYLDKHEVGAFCQRLGLLLTKAEVAQALSEMETDSTRDGRLILTSLLHGGRRGRGLSKRVRSRFRCSRQRSKLLKRSWRATARWGVY